MPLAPRPQIPELTAAIKDPCPPADLLADGSLATLTRSDASLALEYARCREKHLAAVAAYELARSKLNGRPPRGKPKDGG